MKNLYFLIAVVFIFNIANAQSPTITSFSPVTGAIGTLIAINGTNLNNPTSFIVGGIAAVIVSNTGTTLVGMVMPGATTGNVSITTANGTVTSVSDFTVTATSFPSVQQGNKLVGTGAIGAAFQGIVSLSADANTAIVGGPEDNNNIGAAWIYTRTGGIWTQQGNKLVGSGAVGSFVGQGQSVAISADGNTTIVGGCWDNYIGAAWIFTRTGSQWTQQGNKLVGTGAIGNSQQGYSVSISANGNTAIVGGCSDNGIGAAWVYTCNQGVWTQQGDKLVGAGAIGFSWQGVSVSLSADGNTAIVGGTYDNYIGAAWVYTRTGSLWTQQGNKLVGAGYFGPPFILQGQSVSLSADGNTVLLGGDGDNSATGATWVFTRTEGVWTQQGNKLVGTGTIGISGQGASVSLSADGNTALVGGPDDNNNIGAAWVFYSSNITNVQSYIEDKDFVIYPNPTNNKIILESESFLQDANISIYNIQGNLLLEQELQNKKSIIEMANFTKGVYILKVSNPERMIVKQLVKE